MLLSGDHVDGCVDEVFYEDDSVLAYTRGGTGFYGIVWSDFEFEFCIGRAGVLDQVPGLCLDQGPVRAIVSRADQRGPFRTRLYPWESDFRCEVGHTVPFVF